MKVGEEFIYPNIIRHTWLINGLTFYTQTLETKEKCDSKPLFFCGYLSASRTLFKSSGRQLPPLQNGEVRKENFLRTSLSLDFSECICRPVEEVVGPMGWICIGGDLIDRRGVEKVIGEQGTGRFQGDWLKGECYCSVGSLPLKVLSLAWTGLLGFESRLKPLNRFDIFLYWLITMKWGGGGKQT